MAIELFRALSYEDFATWFSWLVFEDITVSDDFQNAEGDNQTKKALAQTWLDESSHGVTAVGPPPPPPPPEPTIRERLDALDAKVAALTTPFARGKFSADGKNVDDANVNVASCAKSATGVYDVVFTAAAVNSTNWQLCAAPTSTGAGTVTTTNFSTSGVTFETYNGGDAADLDFGFTLRTW